MVILSLRHRLLSNNLIVIFWVIFVAFVGIRFESIDYGSYKLMYEEIIDASRLGFFYFTPDSGGKPVESIFAGLVLITKFVGGNFVFFVFVVALLSLTVKFYSFYKMSNFFYLSLLLYVSEWMASDLGQIRSGLASSFILLTVYFLRRKQRAFALSTASMSVLVHSTAVVGFILIIFRRISGKNFMSFCLFCAYIIAMLGGAGLTLVTMLVDYVGLGGEYRLVRYMKYSYAEGYSLFGGTLILYFSLSLLFLFFYEKLKKVNDYNTILIPMFVYGLVLMLLFKDYGIVLARVKGLMCVPSLMIVLPSFILVFSQKSRPIVLFFVIFISAVLFYFSVNSMEAYKTILSS